LFKLLTGTAPTQPVPAVTNLCHKAPRAIEKLLQRLLAPDQEDRPECLTEVIETLRAPARRANLPLLVSPLCESETLASQTQPFTPGQLIPKLVNRRSLLVAAAATAASVTLWPRLNSTRSTLGSDRWRSLKPVTPRFLLSLGAPERTSCDVLSNDRIQIVSEDLTLVHLGRPVVGLFRLRVDLQPNEIQPTERQSSGIFFQAQLTRRDAGSVFRFQTVELKRGRLNVDGDITSRYPDRLTWNLWTATRTGERLTATHTPLSEIAVKLNQGAASQQLVLTFGRQGMPEITFNGDKLHQTMWKFSQEARNHQRLSPTQLPTAFLGQLGLFSSNGKNTFQRPQLAYLQDTRDA